MKIENKILKPPNLVKLLGTFVDMEIIFEEHIVKICTAASPKFKRLCRII